jgi:glycosyltransferase involved in cell wall biosynthesis
LVDIGHDPVLWLAGDHVAFDRNRGYRDSLLSLAYRLGISDRVEFLGLREDILAVMKCATVVILPSLSEGHPRVVLEAMALGKLVVSSPAGGVVDTVIDGLTGRLFDFENAEGLADCIDSLARNPSDSERMASLAGDYVRRCYRPDDHTRKALRIFEEAVRLGPC